MNLEMCGCVVIDGRRYIEFELLVDGERIRSRMPMDILMRWESLRDRAVLKMLEGGT
jgi:hypothetical protein